MALPSSTKISARQKRVQGHGSFVKLVPTESPFLPQTLRGAQARGPSPSAPTRRGFATRTAPARRTRRATGARTVRPAPRGRPRGVCSSLRSWLRAVHAESLTETATASSPPLQPLRVHPPNHPSQSRRSRQRRRLGRDSQWQWQRPRQTCQTTTLPAGAPPSP